MPPPFLNFATEAEYRQHYQRRYCARPIITADGIPVYFDSSSFGHAFFESVIKRDDTFSFVRAQRMDWIALTLMDPAADRFQGWDQKAKVYVPYRRVEVVHDDFVVILQISRKLNRQLKAKFITCFEANNSIAKIRGSPPWSRADCEKELQ